MSQIHESRFSEHPFIDRVWQTQNQSNGTYLATPDGSWDIIVLIENGSRSVLLTGQASEPAYIPYRAGTSSVVISFAAGAFLPAYPGKRMLNLVEMLPCPDQNHFVLDGHTFAIPTYKTAEQMVCDMVEQGVLQLDPVVASILNGDDKALSDRAKQRHFLQVTGLTRKTLQQIRRAQQAVQLLQSGKSPISAAAEGGFADQAHLSKSLKKIMHRLPSNVDDIHKL